MLLDLVVGKTWSCRAQDAPRQARTREDTLASYCKIVEAQKKKLHGDRTASIASLDPENAYQGSPTEASDARSYIIGDWSGSNNASSGSLTCGKTIVLNMCKLGIPLTNGCFQDPSTGADPCSLPIESPFLACRRSSSTLIDSCLKSPSENPPSGMARTTSVAIPLEYAGSKRDISCAQNPWHHQQGLPWHKTSASSESSRCGVPSGISSKTQHHFTTTTALNDAADLQKWVSYAGSHYPMRAASHHSKKASVDYTEKSHPKRSKNTQSVKTTSAPQLAVHDFMTIRHLTSGIFYFMIAIVGTCLEIETLLHC